MPRARRCDTNLIIQGLSGDLGRRLQIRTSKVTGRTYVHVKTNFQHKRKDSPAQGAQKQAFREAAAYAEANKENPVYIAKAKGRKGKSRQPYNVAMADWFQVIRILSSDDVRVDQVRVEISDGKGVTRETGQAALALSQWWEYTLQQAHSGDLTVTVFAKDLPGHVTQASERRVCRVKRN